jgi:hypothetical protein
VKTNALPQSLHWICWSLIVDSGAGEVRVPSATTLRDVKAGRRGGFAPTRCASPD